MWNKFLDFLCELDEDDVLVATNHILTIVVSLIVGILLFFNSLFSWWQVLIICSMVAVVLYLALDYCIFYLRTYH